MDLALTLSLYQSIHSLVLTINPLVQFCLDIPPLGTYKHLSSFEMDNRATMPKTNYYSFGLSATREQMSKVYNPAENSPRSSLTKDLPGPGEYKYKNYSTGTGGRHFSFLKRTKNSQGKPIIYSCAG